MDTEGIDLDEELAHPADVILDSSDEEAAVTPIQEPIENDFHRIFRLYRIAPHANRRRYTSFLLTRNRPILSDSEIDDRLFDADTQIALRISMDTYKPTTKTVNKTMIDKTCPVIKARHQKEKCTVCQEHIKRNDDIRILPCHHYLHDECMVGWYTQGNAICPVCRDKTFERKPNKKRKRN